MRKLNATAAAGNLISTLLHGSHGNTFLADLGLARDSLSVCSNVEHDEENEIAAQDDASGGGGVRLAGTTANVGQPRRVGTGVIIPRRKVDKACYGSSVRNLALRRWIALLFGNLPRSITNCAIWSRVIHSFQETFTPRALWK